METHLELHSATEYTQTHKTQTDTGSFLQHIALLGVDLKSTHRLNKMKKVHFGIFRKMARKKGTENGAHSCRSEME